MSRRQPGRVRRRLVALLREAGFELEPEDLQEAQGYWRQKRQENYVWDGMVRHRDRAIPVEISSFDPMTECVRYGFTVGWRKPWWAEIHSKAPPKPSASAEKSDETREEAQSSTSVLPETEEE